MSGKGDFKYNGVPIFKVGLSDFSYIIECNENGSRILSRNILNENLQDFYKKSRDKSFGVYYEGVIIDFRDLKKSKIE